MVRKRLNQGIRTGWLLAALLFALFASSIEAPIHALGHAIPAEPVLDDFNSIVICASGGAERISYDDLGLEPPFGDPHSTDTTAIPVAAGQPFVLPDPVEIDWLTSSLVTTISFNPFDTTAPRPADRRGHRPRAPPIFS